jgi:carbonic anhydrase
MPDPDVFKGHKRYCERFAADNEVFVKLAEEGQHPKVLWIGCSDSRVIPELITGAEPGEIFMVRNIANIVPPHYGEAAAAGAAIEYAVRHLQVEHAVICGHTGCGGIQALERTDWSEDDAHLETWIEWARPALTRVLEMDVPDSERMRVTTQVNVLLQCENLRSYPCAAAAEDAGRLSIHAWVYDLYTGHLHAFDPEPESWTVLVPPV